VSFLPAGMQQSCRDRITKETGGGTKTLCCGLEWLLCVAALVNQINKLAHISFKSSGTGPARAFGDVLSRGAIPLWTSCIRPDNPFSVGPTGSRIHLLFAVVRLG